MKSRFELNKADSGATLYLYADIGAGFFEGVASEEVASALSQIEDSEPLSVRINSLGGAIHEGLAIYNLLKQRSGKVTTYNDGYAASIASVILLAGDDIEVAKASRVMVHDPCSERMGTADDFRSAAASLDQAKEMIIGIYADKTGKSKEELSAMMSAETWMLADEAVENGFATSITEEAALAAYGGGWASFRNAPESLSVSPSDRQQAKVERSRQHLAVLDAINALDTSTAIGSN